MNRVFQFIGCVLLCSLCGVYCWWGEINHQYRQWQIEQGLAEFSILAVNATIPPNDKAALIDKIEQLRQELRMYPGAVDDLWPVWQSVAVRVERLMRYTACPSSEQCQLLSQELDRLLIANNSFVNAVMPSDRRM